MTPEQIELVEQYLENSIPAAGAKRLLELIEEGGEFRAEFAEALRMHGLVHAGVGPDAACEHLAEVVAIAIPSGKRNLDSRVMEQIREQGLKPAPLLRRRPWARIAAVASAAGLLFAGAWLLFGGSAPVRMVAAGSDVALERGGSRIAAAPPVALRGGDIVTLPPNGWAWIRYADGTTLQVGSDSRVTIEGEPAVAKRLRVDRGVVFADVVAQAGDRPMILVSPHSETKVIGTSFSLAVGKDATKLLVRQGKVAFSKPEGDGSIQVTGGQVATAAKGSALAAEPVRGELLRRLGKDHFLLGVMSGWSEKWVTETRDQGCRWDLRYQHLAANWTQWNANGAFVTMYLQESDKLGILPVFTYYGMIRSSPAKLDAGDLSAELAKTCRDRGVMQKYFNDVKLLMQKAGAFGKPVIVHVEPGVWAQFLTAPAFRAQGLGRIEVSVKSSGVPELEGLDDTAASFGKAFGVLRDRYAPNVLLAWHVAKADGLSPEAAADALLSCGAWELLFTEVGDRDAGFKEARGLPGAWWKESDFTEFRDWGREIYARTGLPLMIWRIPLGNTHMAACNNTAWHYMDNRAEYWLENYPTNRHLAEWADAGFAGLLFGGGTIDCTVHRDNAKDGVTNPLPIAGNKGEQSAFPDDDGGYLRLRAGNYYQSGPLRFQRN
ncbi:MAG: FecR domain-containing protein [Planctomycetes bacterium]|nr:FecR domain-containing protein [Planctomycetota bacterium]